MTHIMPTPISCARISDRSWPRSYSAMVVVTALGSSAEPMGAGSTYLRTVMSARVSRSGRGRVAPTVLLVDLQLAVVVDAEDDQVGGHVEGAEAVEDVGVLHRDLLGQLDQEEDDDQVGAGLG